MINTFSRFSDDFCSSLLSLEKLLDSSVLSVSHSVCVWYWNSAQTLPTPLLPPHTENSMRYSDFSLGPSPSLGFRILSYALFFWIFKFPSRNTPLNPLTYCTPTCSPLEVRSIRRTCSFLLLLSPNHKGAAMFFNSKPQKRPIPQLHCKGKLLAK